VVVTSNIGSLRRDADEEHVRVCCRNALEGGLLRRLLVLVRGVPVAEQRAREQEDRRGGVLTPHLLHERVHGGLVLRERDRRAHLGRAGEVRKVVRPEIDDDRLDLLRERVRGRGRERARLEP
jgi:hypothetical protein